MCGLAGIVLSPHGRLDERVLLAMRDVQRHRGPDEAGIYLGHGVGLGHRRLSIVDLSHGQQPMVDEAAGLALIYNGELYNFKLLKAELEALGVVFASHSDTEVLLRAWQQWGEACLSRLVGMFSFAVWDMRTQRVFLARDHVGIKPLYYGFTRAGDLVFASELKGLMAHPDVDRKLDPQALEDYLAFGYVPDPKSIYKGIFKLQPGHWLSWRAGEPAPVPRQYWDLQFEIDGGATVDQAIARLRSLVDDAVASQMVSDVPLGAFLSGGVDSSAVVASMSRQTEAPVNTCSMGFDDSRFDETAYARQVAQHLHTNHFEERVSSEDFDLLDMLAGIYDEPFADSSALPTWRVCQLARKHVTVALSGDGGDENFAGYRRYRLHAWESGLRARLPLALRKPLFGFLGRVYPKADWAPRPLRAKTTLQALACDDVEAYFHSVTTTSVAMRQQLYSASFKRELQGYSALTVFREHAKRAPTGHPLLLAQYLDLKTWLPGDILTKVDRASMAHSLEVRVPLLDHRLVEWAASLPAELKMKGGTGKYIFKKALEPDLPHDVLYRTKMGFSVPLAAWLRGPLAQRVREALLSGAVAECGYFELSMLDRLVREHVRGALRSQRNTLEPADAGRLPAPDARAHIRVDLWVDGRGRDHGGVAVNPCILLFGMPRSGTTWIGKLFDSHPDTLYRHEPDSLRLLSLPHFPDKQTAPQYRDELEEFLSSLPRLRSPKVVGKQPLFRKDYQSATALLAYRASVTVAKVASRAQRNFPCPYRPTAEGYGRARLVWKSIESLGRLGVCMEAFPDARAIHLMRHPCGYVASILRGQAARRFASWEPSADDLWLLKLLLDTPTAKAHGLDLDGIKRLTPEERLAWRWVLLQEKVLADVEGCERVLTVKYEDVCAKPLAMTRRMFEFAGLDWQPQTERFVRASTEVTHADYYSVFKTSQESADRWRSELEPVVIKRIMQIFKTSSAYRFYSDDLQMLVSRV